MGGALGAVLAAVVGAPVSTGPDLPHLQQQVHLGPAQQHTRMVDASVPDTPLATNTAAGRNQHSST